MLTKARPVAGSPQGLGPATAIQRARKLVLYMLLALGTCTVITAALLVFHIVDSRSDMVITVRQQQSGRAAASRPAAGAGAATGGGANTAVPHRPAAPITKELDPDFIERASEAIRVRLKSCPAGCEKRGNCNAEEGRCECPFGYVGPTCEKMLFPACRMTLASPEMHCGEAMPRSCECFRQCRAHFCPNKGKCEAPRDPWFVRCFERLKPAAPAGGNSSSAAPGPIQIVSDIPEEWEEQQGLVKWYRGIRQDLQREIITRPHGVFVRALAPGSHNLQALPLSKCPAKCTGRGQCITSASMPPKCLCWQGYTGDGCEQMYKAACVNHCNNRGTCKGGFCHCQAGYWGKDCGRSKAYAPHNAHSSITALKIYVYELPTHLAIEMDKFSGVAGLDPTYIAYRGFLSGFLADWSVRTENPWEANMFYVPALTFTYSSNLGDVTEHLRRVMTWVREAHPFFNRTGGRDHFFWLPNDRGACWIDPNDPLLGNAVKIVHFGFHQENSPLLGDFRFMPNNGAACYKPERDIVAAPYSYQQETLAKETFSTFDPNNIPQGKLLFFAGSIKEKEYEYSGGVRQELWKLFKSGKLGDKVLVSPENNLKNYKQLVQSSKFCLAPWGHGWGNRLGQYMVMGCVPVIVQDGVHQPYQDLLPYNEFSIRLPKARLPHIAEVLEDVSDRDYRRLRAGVAQYWHAFVWHPSWGGQAYNYTMQSLRRRAYDHLAGLY